MGGTNTTRQSEGGGASGSRPWTLARLSSVRREEARLRETAGWAGRVTQLPRTRGEACLTDLQQGRRHHVLSGGRRWPLGLDCAATMVMAGRSGNERVARDGRALVGQASGEASGMEPGSQAWTGPGPAETRAARLQESLGTEKGARGAAETARWRLVSCDGPGWGEGRE